FFFFQAEDGIRDFHVTGVQTCALPISPFARNQLSRYALLIASPYDSVNAGIAYPPSFVYPRQQVPSKKGLPHATRSHSPVSISQRKYLYAPSVQRKKYAPFAL